MTNMIEKEKKNVLLSYFNVELILTFKKLFYLLLLFFSSTTFYKKKLTKQTLYIFNIPCVKSLKIYKILIISFNIKNKLNT